MQNLVERYNCLVVNGLGSGHKLFNELNQRLFISGLGGSLFMKRRLLSWGNHVVSIFIMSSLCGYCVTPGYKAVAKIPWYHKVIYTNIHRVWTVCHNYSSSPWFPLANDLPSLHEYSLWLVSCSLGNNEIWSVPRPQNGVSWMVQYSCKRIFLPSIRFKK